MSKMRDGTVIDPRDWSTQRWKNGGGVTHEIFRRTDPKSKDLAEGAYDIRISVAEIEGAQPFSFFPGFDRVLIPLEDTTLRMVIGGVESAMTRHHAFHFAGSVEVATRGEGRAADLNIITRVERGAARVEVATIETAGDAKTDHLAIFALEALTLRDRSGLTIDLKTRQMLLHLDHARELTLTASAPVVWIRF